MCSRPREPERKKKEKMSKKKTRKILEKIADAMGFKLVVDEYFVFFAKRDEERHQLSPAYGKDILETFLERCVFKAEKFWEGIANPFCGCRSAEEALVRIDLLEGRKD